MMQSTSGLSSDECAILEAVQKAFDGNVNLLCDEFGPPSFNYKSELVQWKREKAEKTKSPQTNQNCNASSSLSAEPFDTSTLIEHVVSNCADGEIVLSSLLRLIRSLRTNEEIQNEIIDLIGMDKIDLVEKILVYRIPLVEEINKYFLSCKRIHKQGLEVAGYGPAPERHTAANHPCGIFIQTKADAKLNKHLLKQERKIKKELNKIVSTLKPSERDEFYNSQLQYQKKLLTEKNDKETDIDTPFVACSIPNTKLPYVFDSSKPHMNLSLHSMKYSLPEGTKRRNTNLYEEIIVPPTSGEKSLPKDFKQVEIQSLGPIGQKCFEGLKTLNTIQSVVFEKAYNSLENLLICAPTGAGKTNIAMLTILKTVREHLRPTGEIDKNAFKTIYIAPMKALASEMTQSFAKRLSRIGLKVRELTGDTQLTKREISETQMLILTPEKWDVLTRKADDEILTQLVRLIIIDEVHLLHDDRGPVIEVIIARTLRQMEAYHQKVRIVGLSATLPNYIDVAQFLHVNPERGLFFFDGRFRPVPLAQTFVGVHDVRNTDKNRDLFDDACYDKCIQFLRDDHQILVFVHTRNSTVRLGKAFADKAALKNELSFFLPASHNISGAYLNASRTVGKDSKNNEMKELFQRGIGIHHAGLIRSDRNLMERMFTEGHIRVLICTSTLAWGVNLPAHAVIIRGTEIYDPQRGDYTDIGVLDVQQIFGRAGRPQYESVGHGIILTQNSKLSRYIDMLVRQAPIESQFQTHILDNLNAEIARGTVTTIKEAVEWLRLTYFYIRARRNPLAYGLNYHNVKEDPNLENFLTEICIDAACKLDRNRMARFDSAFVVLSEFCFYKSPSFERCTMSRMDEMADLEELASFGCVFPIKSGGLANSEGKVNCLLQSYISRAHVANFALISETFYISQNASRIARGLFEIVLRRGWAQATSAFLQMSKCIQHKIWPFNSPLRNFISRDKFFRQLMDIDLLKQQTVTKIENRQLTIDRLWEIDAKELGSLFSCDGAKLYEAIRMIPIIGVEATIKPITRTILQVEALLTPSFYWNDRFLGSNSIQRFWIFVEDLDDNLILHYEQMTLNKKRVIKGEVQKFVFVVPIHDKQLKHKYQLRIAHDSIMVEDTIAPLSLHNCILPSTAQGHTDLLDLDPLPITALQNEIYQNLYSFEYFNPIQTQVFFTLYNTDENTLIGAPTSSGKTLCAELAIFRLFNERPGKKCVYIAPLKALVRERVLDWRKKFVDGLGVSVVEVSGDHTPELAELNAASILIATPEKWDGITRNMETQDYVRDVELLIIDEIHLLGVERGAVLEAIITRIKSFAMRKVLSKLPIRIVGLSTALANAFDVADWIHVKEHALFNFRPSVRPVPVEVHIQGFTGQHYCPRMALMNKPAFKAIKQFSATKSTLVFVASRRQTRLTAMSFVSLLAMEANSRQWLHMEEDELQRIVKSVKDDNLKITLTFGIGMHHAGLQHYERSLVERLFVERKIQVLITTATLAWGINVPAHLVIVKGTEYYDGKTHKYVDFPVTDVLQMIGRAGRPQYDTSAVAVVFVQDVKKNFYKKFLYDPFPIESSLMPVLPNHVNAEICGNAIGSKQEVLNYLAGTYLYRRLFANPSYYHIEDYSSKGMTRFLSKVVDNCLLELVDSHCAIVDSADNSITPTPLGQIASKYYLEHLTIRHFAEKLCANLSVEELLQILADCPEYAEIPVRHNEDGINQEIHNYLPIKLPNKTEWESPHVKTHLLYQAHFSQIQIPVDYLTDQRSILESCIRIIQAMFDFCVIHEWLNTALNVIILLQQVAQARWYNDHPLLCLPHLSIHSIDGLAPLSTIPQFQEQLGIYGVSCAPEKRIKQLIQRIMENSILEEFEAKEVVDALLKWPALHISDARFQEGLNECVVSIRHLEMKSVDYTPLVTATDYKLRLQMEILGYDKRQYKACCTKFPKEKTSGWIVILGDKKSHKIYATQRVHSFQNNGRKFVRMPFTSPTTPGRYCLTIFVMSDSYLGIDQEYNIFCDVKAPF